MLTLTVVSKSSISKKPSEYNILQNLCEQLLKTRFILPEELSEILLRDQFIYYY